MTATYDRPHLMRRVIRSVLCQTVQDWHWIIVGDACADATGEMIASFGDPRITYVNLPQRFGEQAGPNDVGLALADTPFVALLNHDDLWLPDHLAVALAQLEGKGVDLCIARAAFLVPRGPSTALRSVFAEQSLKGRDLGDAYEAPNWFVEPLSAWCGTRNFFDDLGPMRLATTLSVPPVQEWAMRAAQRAARVAMPDAVTVLKRHGRADYATEEAHMEDLVALIEAGRAEAIHELIADDLWLSAQLGATRDWQEPDAATQTPGRGAVIHRRCDLDRVSLDAAARYPPGDTMRQLLHSRTGQTLGPQPDISEAIAHARRILD